jgi:hypothetical protein
VFPTADGHIILAIGNADLTITDSFSLSGIALGTLVAVIGYHLANAFAPKDLDEGALTVVGRPGVNEEEQIPPHEDHRKH